MTLLLILILAQTPAPPAPPPPATPPAPPPLQSAPTPPPNFTYAPDGRRDPFVSLVNRGSDAGSKQTGGARPAGIAGIRVEEVVVSGIVQTRSGWVAMVAGPDRKTHTIRPGDRLMDGSVRIIAPQYVVLLQEVNDPLRLEKQREVRKYLRGEVK